MPYEHLTFRELTAYYSRVKKYIDDGFRADGLKEELELILKSIKEKARAENLPCDAQAYESEIRRYIRRLRH
ncbi:hypothetical protein CR205_05980 [Alteribacter lacisalsi]|jgi:hypothetical protein|uniref:Uncharacterized protein n=1 Tax=Alteribacter lacisalsi TaxID=2045244 RepID=A0A2W0HM56_9BACI|nr:hypothetical protein [Alteribacter lacisalsi]PYZ98142.1 hypothetical protein CR205_05980 [Alteribacter lacisalsi]